MESLTYVPIEFEPAGSKQKEQALARATESLIRKIKQIGIRELVRFGLSRRALEKIYRRDLVPIATLREKRTSGKNVHLQFEPNPAQPFPNELM